MPQRPQEDAMTALSAAPTRRERMRAQTLAEIKAEARRQLVASGPSGVSLRALAREVGMTAPALYRYFPSLEDLVDAVTVDLFNELVAAMEHARDSLPADEVVARLVAISHAFRTFAVAHPHEFQLMFGTPPGALGQEQTDACQEASSRFGNVFAEQFREVWRTHPFPVADDDALTPHLADAIDNYWSWLVAEFAPDMPKGAVIAFLQAWVRIYGTVALEVFGHLGWAMSDGAPLFEQTLYDIGASWGLKKHLPRA
jgi:AcrR family transcriptional regulator